MQRSKGRGFAFWVVVQALLAAILLSGCDFWPRTLEPLEESIAEQVSGEVTAWLVSGDVVVVHIAKSPLYRSPPAELEAVAKGIAGQIVNHVSTPLESIAITFHEAELSEDPERTRDFIFLVVDNQAELQPALDLNASGPLNSEEIRAAVDRLGDTLDDQQRPCVLERMGQLANDAGDPETLDPATIELLPNDSWAPLDALGKRLVLAQVITTQALFDCAGAR